MPVIALDSETHLIARANLAPRLVCVSWADPAPGLALAADARPRVEAWLSGQDTLVGTNVAYDMAVFGQFWPDLLELIWAKYDRDQIEDVSIREKLLRIAVQGRCEPAYSLDTLAGIYELPALDKQGPWRMDFARLDGLAIERWPAGAREYVLADASTPLAVFEAQAALDRKWQDKTGFPILHVAAAEARKAFALHLISCWGVHTHPERTRAFHARLLATLAEGKAELEQAGLVRPDGSRNVKAAKARMVQVCQALEIDPAKTDKDGISLDKEACETVGDLLLKAYSLYSRTTNLLARAEDLLQGFELPLQTRFDSLLETARTSTSKPAPPLVGVQAQNFPREAGARECLTPRPGHVFLVCDLPTAELRSLAQKCIRKFGKSDMADQINAGRDLHLWFAAQILGIEYDEAKVLLAAADKAIKEARQQAKPCNFGFPGGMGIDNFRAFAWRTYRVRLTVERARQLKAIWMGAFREMPLFFDWISGMFPGERQYALIRDDITGYWRGRVPYCAACNNQFQHLTAVGAGAGLVDVQRACYAERRRALYQSRVVLYTHDEIVTETPRERAAEAGPELALLMREAFNRWHPDVPVLDKDMHADCVEIYAKG